MKEKEMYKRAALTIERYGWIQNRFGNEKEGYCLLGACRYANTNRYQRKQLTVNTLRNTCPGSIIFTNDKLLINETEAILLLGFAYELAKDEGN